ncbi:uncharacterized protein LOC110446192 [Mizuhopecten yessoensis]|uniref:uncharacterized protein LOC110446192 n=1 Tax=Mizuhopecten yessoensis TaxID=6573 RepID=UPI000B45B596|nr:uncharacterized protein LOC110446192 [Mizuhopecten yessoensis]
MDMDEINRTPLYAPVFSLLDDKAKTDCVLGAANKVNDTLGFCNFRTITVMREDLQALQHNDSQLEAMKHGDIFECALCDKTYIKSGWFKKHLEKRHSWKFHSVQSKDADLNPVQSFLLISFLLRDSCDAFKMGDGDRIVRNAYLEWLYASAVRHIKYRLWLWRMISYAIAILDTKDSFEYKWNMTVNLPGEIQNNIPNDNCVEIQVHNIKRQLNTQGANKSFKSAKQICMTTQVIDGIKEQLMKTTETVKPRVARPTADKTKDVVMIVQNLRQKGQVKDLTWESFSNFKEPLNRISSMDIHDWINTQRRIASFYM